MNIGRLIKHRYGTPTEVDYVLFNETQTHIVLMIKTFDLKVTHKQVNAVLDRYPLGDDKNHWIFVESRIMVENGYTFPYDNRIESYCEDTYMMSVYRINKETAMKKLL